VVKRRPKPTKRAAAARRDAQAALEQGIHAPKLPIARDLEIYEIYCEGNKSVRDLASEYGLSKTRISDICRAVENWLATQSIMQIRGLRMRATRRLDLIFEKAMIGFEESRQDEVTITTVDDGDTVKTTEQRRGQVGSPGFLHQAREATRDLLELWGANAPKVIRTETPEPMRVGGRSPEEALKARIEYLRHLETVTKPHDN
jgi:hypothetical protein